MKIQSALAVGLTLAGCTTMAEVQNKAPTFIAVSQKPAPAIEECLALKLSRMGQPTVVRGEGRTILSYGQPNPALTLTIVERSDDRAIEGRSGVGPVSGVTKEVNACL